MLHDAVEELVDVAAGDVDGGLVLPAGEEVDFENAAVLFPGALLALGVTLEVLVHQLAESQGLLFLLRIGQRVLTALEGVEDGPGFVASVGEPEAG